MNYDGNALTIRILNGVNYYFQTVEDIIRYGGWQPFDLRTRDDWRRRQLINSRRRRSEWFIPKLRKLASSEWYQVDSRC